MQRSNSGHDATLALHVRRQWGLTSRLRSLVCLGVLALISAAASSAALAGAPQATEYELKAEFVWRFTLYIKWPEEAIPAEGPFVIGVIGDTSLLPIFEETVAGRTIHERPVEVRAISDFDDLADCRIVFIAAAAVPELPRILKKTSGLPILTVGDSDGFGERGVMINFFLVEDQLLFEINESAARDCGLVLSSKLLRVGRTVETVAELIQEEQASVRE